MINLTHLLSVSRSFRINISTKRDPLPERKGYRHKEAKWVCIRIYSGMIILSIIGEESTINVVESPYSPIELMRVSNDCNDSVTIFNKKVILTTNSVEFNDVKTALAVFNKSLTSFRMKHDKSRDVFMNFSGIDNRSILFNDPLFLHSPYPFRYRRL